MRSRTAIILIGLLGAAGVAVYYYERQITLLEQLTYEMVSFNVRGQITAQLMTLDFTVRLFSHSTIDAQVSAMYIDIYINGIKLGSVTNNQGFIIPAMGYSDAPLQVNISPALLASDLVGLLLGGLQTQNFTIGLVGYIQIKEAFLKISVPFTYNTTLQQLLQN